MGLINTFQCYMRKKNLTCSKNYYYSLLDEKEQLSLCIRQNEERLNKAKQKLASIDSFKNILLFRIDAELKLQSNHCDYYNKNCELHPDSCKRTCYQLGEEIKALRVEYEKSLSDIKQYNDVFEHLNELYKEKPGNIESIYFKPRYDKFNFLTCTMFDLSAIDIRNSMKSYALFLSFGHTAVNKRTRLYFEYKYNGSIEIIDFFSIIKRQRHGTYVLQSLLDLIPYFNKAIIEYNLEFYQAIKDRTTWEEFKESYVYANEITKIYGRIVPDGSLTVEQLTEFYNKNGFIKDGRLIRDL